MSRPLSIALLYGILLLTTSAAAGAQQRVLGRILGVFDDASGQPISGVEVVDLSTGTKAVTTETGTISLNWLPAGTTILQIRKLGYASKMQSVSVSPTDTASITVVLTPLTQSLPTVVSTAKRVMTADPGLRGGFETRCQSKLVSCFREAEISKYPSRTLGDFVARADGVTSCSSGVTRGSERPGSLSGCVVAMRATAGPGKCTPTYFVDGFVWDARTLGAPFDPPHGVQRAPFTVSNTAGIEVYSSEKPRPLRFEGHPGCGAIVIWTK